MTDSTIPHRSHLPYVRLGRPQAIALLAIYALAFYMFALWVVKESGYMQLPPEVGDGHAYENIAFNLWKGHGFGHNWTDPEWRAPYVAANRGDYYDWVLAHGGVYSPTAFRPPLFPVILAGLYTTTGRDFSTWRYVNIGITVAAACLTAVVAYNLAGIWPALIVSVLAFFDTTLLFYVHRYMTESLAAFLFAALLYVLLQFVRRPDRELALLGGCIYAVMLLLRNVFLLWLPLVLLVLCIAAARKRGWKEAANRAFFFVFPALILVAPWYLRNAAVTDWKMPLGTQGAMVMAVGYSDAMFETGGKWTFEAKTEIHESFPAVRVPGIEGEILMALEGKKRTAAWIADNLGRLPQLFALKISSLWWSDAQNYQKFLAVLSCFGLLLLWKSGSFTIFSALLIANTLAIGLTWNVPYGRFLIPVHPALYALAACAIYSIAHCFIRGLSTAVRTMRRSPADDS